MLVLLSDAVSAWGANGKVVSSICSTADVQGAAVQEHNRLALRRQQTVTTAAGQGALSMTAGTCADNARHTQRHKGSEVQLMRIST